MFSSRKFLKKLFKIAVQNVCQKHNTAKKELSSRIKKDPTLIRNIGILAHIDAGKTTTTERMLFYSGTIDSMGEVHHGNTVTDFMDQERERGITITSASVSFPWNEYCINLVDTPGHIDFTVEVELALNAIDGVVIILDGSAGVEAQTLTVWRQANKHKIPRIIYVNKMDRLDANFNSTLKSIEDKLLMPALMIQIPYYEDNSFRGVIDLLKLEKYVWWGKSLGVEYSKATLKPDDNKLLWETAVAYRTRLAEKLADLDDKLADIIINEDKSLEQLSENLLIESLQRITLQNTGVLVTCGSSYKNIGIQLLLDNIVKYLPSHLVSLKNSVLTKYLKKELCAQVFKVRYDSFKGPVTFLRVYSGHLKKGQKVYNVEKEKSEQLNKLFIAYADDYEEIDEIHAGNIAAVTGLKDTMTGDYVTSSFSLANVINSKLKTDPNFHMTTIPEPVFFCSIEPPSQAYQAQLDRALFELSRQDSSLKVHQDPETGQTVLSGMGELHLDVIKERIRSEYKINAELGPLQIAYKEALIGSAKDSHDVNLTIGSTQHSVKIVMSVAPRAVDSNEDILTFDRSHESASNVNAIYPKHLIAIRRGIDAALNHGPKLSCPVINVKATLHWFEVIRGTADTVITSATSQCLQKLLTQAGTKLLEPVMNVEIIAPNDYMSPVIADMSRRRASITDIHSRGADKVLEANVPLSELLGYATFLRTLTSGHASFTFEFFTLQEMNALDEAKAIKSVTGLYPD